MREVLGVRRGRVNRCIYFPCLTSLMLLSIDGLFLLSFQATNSRPCLTESCPTLRWLLLYRSE